MRLWSKALLGTILAMAADGATAQSPTPLPRNTTPPSPQNMPGDYFDIPQSAQLKVPLGPPASGRNSAPLSPPAPSISQKLAGLAAQTALASCAADGYAITVAVSDADGRIKAALAADGTRDNGLYMAMHKTLTVVGFHMSTLQLREKIEQDPSVLQQVKPNMSLLPGGMPIWKQGVLVGAIATSGASAYVEEKCAADGIASIIGQL
ncbi:heme-binding protein [Novosphingobium umbonatum]|uniref:Heme-binding protein n=1 Tax=Novosphingobium umbonatum TaxID=1908524 RepID=A0A437N6X9_9SPHN|nr:heme-binding protein [Novosphingobium umbonatum]RVU05670.1 heme-binding protein [Novosphingobium umbonatum]